MTVTWQNVVFDCGDSHRLARFWSEVLALPLFGPEDDDPYCWLEPGEGMPDLLFLPVPEGKTVKNRVHIDLRPDDQAAEVERLIALGARRADIGQGDVTWVVMADPEGNEFCVLSSRPAS